MVQTKKDIVAILSENLDRIRAFGVRRLGLFGSFVRNQQSPESDVDVLVEFDANQKTFDNFMDLSFFLEDKLERRVEVVTTEALSPHIGPHILGEVEYVPFPAWAPISAFCRSAFVRWRSPRSIGGSRS